MTSAPGISFDVRSSRRLVVWVGAFVCMAFIAIFISAMSWWLKLLFALICAVYACWQCWLLHQRPISRVAWFSDGEWQVELADGQHVPAQLQSHAQFMFCLVLTLHYLHTRRKRIILCPDNSTAQDRRRLRIRLAARIYPEKQ